MADQLTPPFDPANDPVLIDEGHDVDIVVFVDFADAHTREVRKVLPRAEATTEPHKARLAVRFMPTEPGTDSDRAARAAIAAWRQDAFAEMHDAIMDGPLSISTDTVTGYARDLNLDLERFARDMNAPETDAILDNHAQSYNASPSPQTPALFIDGKPFVDAWDPDILSRAITRPLGLRLREASEDFFQWAASAGLVLVLATLAALAVANFGGATWYNALLETEMALTVGSWALSLDLAHWVNDGLMALFFLLVGLEIKREIVSGELSTLDKAILPIVGAIGGMVVPALIYVGLNAGTDTVNGWGIPMATDIAFTLGILAVLGNRVPVALKVFVSALAIADDLGAIVVIAVFYGHGFHLDAALWALVILGVMLALNRSAVFSRTPYLILGVVLWYFVFESGIHATLAGVLTAAMIPSRKPADARGVALHAREVIGEEIDRPALSATAVTRLKNAVDTLREPGFHLQHALEQWSNFLILPLFAFFNTGLVLVGSSLSLVAPEVLGVILGLVVGKPLGICLAVWLAIRLGGARLSPDISWAQLFGAATLCGVGFTMSIFIASSAFEGTQLADVKLAILIASVAAAGIGSALMLRAGPPAAGRE